LVKLAGHALTEMLRVASAAVQAKALWVATDCAGAVNAPEEPANVLVYRAGPSSRVTDELTLQPAATQVVKSSGLQSPPAVERACARSPVPT
jgi:hypothetical protein